LLRDGDGRHVLDALGVVEDVFVRRAEFSVAATDKAVLCDQIEPRFDVGFPHVQGRRRREQEALMNLLRFGGRECIVETSVTDSVEGLLERHPHRVRLDARLEPRLVECWHV
jgi:hypothetical protein